MAPIVWKELVQISSRRRFHFEKGLFAAAAAGTFALVALRETALSPEAFKAAAAFSRSVFFPVVIASYAVLSVAALVAASGIIVNEITGKRLDLLRVTSISVGAIVAGKGVAVMGRSLLVAFLLMPVLASMQFYGGVSVDDLAKSFLLIAANLFLFTGLGLWISAGSSTGMERAVRVFDAGVVWTGLAYWLVGFAAGRWTNSPYLVSLSPFWSLRLLAAGSLRWGPAAFSISVYVFLAAAFLARSVYVTPRNLARLEGQRKAPKTRDLGAGLKELGSRVTRWGPLKRLWLGGHFRLGALVATEVRQTSILLLLIVPAVLLSLFGIISSGLLMGKVTRWELLDFVTTARSLLIVAMALVIALQACSLVARGKSRRTIAALVMTPCGGARMLAWKGAAILVNQGFWMALTVVGIIVVGLIGESSGTEVLSQIFSLAVTAVFLFVLGFAFSLLSSSTGFACGLLALSLFVMTPLSMRIVAFLGAFLGRSALTLRSEMAAPVVLGALGVLGLLCRNAWPWAPGLFLAVSVAVALGAAPVVTGLHDHDMLTYESPLMLSASFVFGFWHISIHYTVASSVVKATLAIVLLVGTPLRFTRRAVALASKE